jgi:5-methylcytosine-specific restriction enzyme A
MAESAPHVCNQPGCGHLTTERFCTSHRKKKFEKQRRPWHYLYDTAAWERLRLLVLHRDPICMDPFKTACHNPSTVADHIRDHHGDSYLFWDINNLQGLCEPCHNRKTNQTSARG